MGPTHRQTQGAAPALGQAVKAVLMYCKNNLTQDVIAELLDVSQPTISRTITELEGVIADVLDEFVPDPTHAFPGHVTIIDGTLAPCWSWAHAPHLYSGKHKTTGHNHQAVVDLHGRLLHLSDRNLSSSVRHGRSTRFVSEPPWRVG